MQEIVCRMSCSHQRPPHTALKPTRDNFGKVNDEFESWDGPIRILLLTRVQCLLLHDQGHYERRVVGGIPSCVLAQGDPQELMGAIDQNPGAALFEHQFQ